MTINDMPIGAELCLGSLRVPFTEQMLDLSWKKVNIENQFLFDVGSCIRMQMDNREPDSPSRHRRNRGCSFFPQTALFQWLNATGPEWYQPSCETDCPPDYQHYNGFLTEFSDLEKSMLVKQTFTILTPEGFRKEFGPQVECESFVSLPAYSNLYEIREDGYDSNFRCEGGLFAACVDAASRPFWIWTRSATNGYMIHTRDSDYSKDIIAPTDACYVCPLIKLNQDAEVEQFGDLYVPKTPEGSSSGTVNESELEKIWLE